MISDPTARALAEAMNDRVDGIEASPQLVVRAQQQAERPRRQTLAIGLAATSVLAVIGAAALLRPSDDAPIRPAASASPSTTAQKHPRYAPATLPRGFRVQPFVQESTALPPFEDGRVLWNERLNYGRDFDERNHPAAVISIETTSGDVLPVTVAEYIATEPTARQVVIGDRIVVHVRNALAEPGGLDVYAWSEAPGINIAVTASGDTTDAEVRQFIEAVHRVQ